MGNQSIYTIPMDDIFLPREGCPLCRMHTMLETQAMEFITGSAMMEPSIRIQVNEQGFCPEHMAQLLKMQRRLQVGLMLQSHIDHCQKLLDGKSRLHPTAHIGKLQKVEEDCFVCRRIHRSEEMMLDTVCKQFNEDSSFRELFCEQEQICLPHYTALLGVAEQKLPKKRFAEMVAACDELLKKEMEILQADVSHFCEMFDYRNAGEKGDWGTSKDALRRAAAFLTAQPELKSVEGDK